MRKLVYTLALAIGLLLPVAARADYRYGNHWVASPSLLRQQMLQNAQRFRGPETGWAWHRINFVRCTGDRTGEFDINRARGFYHHFWCAASMYGMQRYYVTFDAWWTGRSTYRTSDIEMVAYR